MHRSLTLALALLLTPGSTAAEGTDEPLVATAQRYFDAAEHDDVETLADVLASGARRFFGEKQGEGVPLEPGKKGPWHGWDEFFRSESEVVEWTRTDQRVVRASMEEINDWFRLVERPPKRYFISFGFDGDGRIAWQLIHRDPEHPSEPGRLAEFEAWARAERPGLLDRLSPGDEIDPSRHEEWKEALLAWRRDAGLPDPLASDSYE